METCDYCGIPYHWRKSSSRYLKMTFCSHTCEVSENGASIENMLAVERFGFPIEELSGKAGK